ncbi:MAG: alcohol dehydrogenase catalytic domain-containing protein [Candidatus Nanohaloarchaea archaeon]
MRDKMKAAVVEEPGKIEIEQREVPEPGEDEVLVKVKASSVCHSDKYAVEGLNAEAEFPRIPGHEVAGVVEETGENVENWHEGDRVGVGWQAGHCFSCERCRRGQFKKCENAEITGLTRDGGHAEYMTARKEAVARVPEDLDFVDAAPLLCAGVTTYNSLRHTGARPGDTVAILGIGGLGHLGVQYASKAGFETVAISHSDKQDYAEELGADHFINSEEEDVAETLQELGGVKVVLSTVPVKEAVEEVIPGLGIDGDLTVVGRPGEPVEVEAGDLIARNASVSGWASGSARDSQDTMEFSSLRNVTPETEVFDLEDYEEAYGKMMEGEVRFRAVLEP